MGREIAGDGNEDVAALVGVAPYAKLPDAGLQHLIGVEARIFAQHRAGERGNQRLRRVAERKVARNEPCRGVDLPLLLILGGVIGGLIAFGLIGIFLGPMVLAVAYTLFNAWLADADVPQTHA